MRWLLLALLCACTRGSGEAELRARLGIPPSAKKVVVFAQNSHLDIDWQKTFPDYYQSFVESIFLEARGLMQAQPRARYSIAEMAYLQKHLTAHPEEAAALQKLAAAGALRVVGGGRTSPDTLLPETELLLRDYLQGVRFAEDTLGARPKAAWLPDSFGHAATAPDILAAAGFESVFIGRIDGAPTVYEGLALHRTEPRPGSSAALLKSLGTADFFWRGPGGGRVLAHWQPAGIYCTGDDIDYDEPLQVPGGHLGPYHGDDPAFTDHKIAGYLDSLSSYAKTPYLFVPVGCDFQHPKDKLIDYLDGYNQRHTDAYAVAASFEEYAQLVMTHSAALPELPLDPTPYFTGFLGSRPGVKRAARDAMRPFLTAEPFAAALRRPDLLATDALAELTLSDHHDFITGTATSAVAETEQLPLLANVQAAGEAALQSVVQELARRLPPAPAASARVLALNPSSAVQSVVADVPGSGRVFAQDLAPFSWRAIDLPAGTAPAGPFVELDLLDAGGAQTTPDAAVKAVLWNARVRAELSRQGLVSLRIDGVETLAGPSLQLREYADQGGLWRLGHEMQGCSLTPSPVAQDATFEVREESALSVRLALRSGDFVREVRLAAADAGLEAAVETAAPLGATRTVTFAPAGEGPLATSLAGGFVERDGDKLYTPTYWPAVSWAQSGGLLLLLRQSTGVRRGGDGALEVLAARNVLAEQCDFEGPSTENADADVHRIEWKLAAAAAPADAERAAQAWNRPARVFAVTTIGDGTLPSEAALLRIDGAAVVSALKPAERGEGVIVRAQLMPGPAQIRFSPLLPGQIELVDAMERDLRPLPSLSLRREDVGVLPSVRLR